MKLLDLCKNVITWTDWLAGRLDMTENINYPQVVFENFDP